MTCPNCNSETHELKYYEKGIINCPYCPDKHSPAPLFSRDMIKVQGAFGGKGKRTAAHNADISRRRLAPDGSVYRDYGRKSFVGCI